MPKFRPATQEEIEEEERKNREAEETAKKIEALKEVLLSQAEEPEEGTEDELERRRAEWRQNRELRKRGYDV